MTNFENVTIAIKLNKMSFVLKNCLILTQNYFSKTIHSIKLNTIEGIKIVLDFQVEGIICKTKVK